MESLGVMNLEGFGIQLDHSALGPAGAVLVACRRCAEGKTRQSKHIGKVGRSQYITAGSRHSEKS